MIANYISDSCLKKYILLLQFILLMISNNLTFSKSVKGEKTFKIGRNSIPIMQKIEVVQNPPVIPGLFFYFQKPAVSGIFCK